MPERAAARGLSASGPEHPPLLARALAGDRRALARLLSALEEGGDAAARLGVALAERAGRARVLGVTGVPGSGKSTLVHALLGAFIARGETVGVVAIDPSSPITGGAVLGDRVRMGEHGNHPNVFVRSFSARGELGGLAQAARAAVDAFDAAGFDRVVVETVGTGQSETAIAALADTRIVACPPGLGDEVQAIKAGTLEIADLLVVTKGDLPFAGQAALDLREMLTLRRHDDAQAWRPRVVVVQAQAPDGLAPLLLAIDAHEATIEPGRRLRTIDSRASMQRPAPTPGGDDAPTSDPVAARLAALAAADGLCRSLGIELIGGGAGRAEVALTVEARHLNFNGGCHGGTIFALADSAFGLASNSHGPVASGIDAHIAFLAGATAGDRLLARATEVQRKRKVAVYRIDVVRRGADGVESAIATFTGTVYVRGDSAEG